MADPGERPQVPGFELHELIGFGGHGEVWRATDQVAGGPVAIKIGRAGGRRPPVQREVALLRRVEHPHLVRLRQVAALPDGRTALVLEFAAGGSLAALVARRGRLGPAEVTTLLIPLAGALEHLHGLGMAHSDLSPANVLFAADGRPLLGDLGVARILGTAEQDSWATAGFADPARTPESDPRHSDVFGLAAVAWYAMTGSNPGHGRSGLARPPELVADAPALTRLLAECLSAAPGSRPLPAEIAARAWQAARPVPIRLLPGTETGSAAEPWLGVPTRRVRQPAVPVQPLPAARGRRHRRRPRRPPSRERPARRLPPVRRIRTHLVAASLLLVALAGIGLAVGRPASDQETGDEQVLAAALRDAGRARAAAFAAASTAPLVAADDPGSPAMAADVALVGRLRASRLRLAGVSYRIEGVRVLRRVGAAVTISAAVTTSAHRRVDPAGRPAASLAPDGPRRVTVVLVSRPGLPWRVREVW